MPRVELHPDRQTPKDIERALRTLKKLDDRCGVQKALRENQAYEKPSIMRKRKKAAAIARYRRELAKTILVEKLY